MRALALVLFLVVAVVIIPGCDTLYSKVVDNVTDPGGKVTTTLGSTLLGDVTALATSNPLVITGMGNTYVISMTAGDDPTGRTGFDVLAAATQSVTINVAPNTRNQLQVHFGGQSCVATSGQLVLSTDANTDIGGTFTASGTHTSDGSACAVSGTLLAIPQSR